MDITKPEFHILHVITTIERGGAEKAVLALAKVQILSGYKVSVLTLKGKLELKEEFLSAGIEVVSNLVNQHPLHQILWIRKNNKHFNLVHCHLPRAECIYFLARASAPFVVTRHNAENFMTFGPKWLSSMISRTITREASYVIAISKAVKSFLVQSEELYIRSKCKVIYYGIEKDTSASKSGGSNNINRILKVGTIARLVPQKNLSLLLHILKHAHELGYLFKATIVGSGELLENLKKQASFLGISEFVFFQGKVSDVGDFFQDIDVFVLTSKYEGFGLSLLEAMTAEVPIVATNNSAIPEVLGIDHPGLFFESEIDCAVQLIFNLKSAVERSRFLLHQKKQLNNFSLEKYFRAHHDLYFQITH